MVIQGFAEPLLHVRTAVVQVGTHYSIRNGLGFSVIKFCWYILTSPMTFRVDTASTTVVSETNGFTYCLTRSRKAGHENTGKELYSSRHSGSASESWPTKREVFGCDCKGGMGGRGGMGGGRDGMEVGGMGGGRGGMEVGWEEGGGRGGMGGGRGWMGGGRDGRREGWGGMGGQREKVVGRGSERGGGGGYERLVSWVTCVTTCFCK